MKTMEQEIVEATIGHWPTTNAPTVGYMRHALEVLGIPTRGQDLKPTELLRMCQEAGLPFVAQPNVAPAGDAVDR